MRTRRPDQPVKVTCTSSYTWLCLQICTFENGQHDIKDKNNDDDDISDDDNDIITNPSLSPVVMGKQEYTHK